ncbi:GAF domain-containing protein [Actinomycetaceae bacterium TAE3-ERU4]|nr:GAF domain-containing protein [Actinomycetaceae bacterium TAE3-ERU4]
MPNRPNQLTLLDASLNLASKLDVTQVLQGFVRQACSLASTEFGALAVLNIRGEMVMMVTQNIDDEVAQLMQDSTLGNELLLALPESGALIVNNPHDDSGAIQLPKSAPEIDNYVCLPLELNQQIFGWLFLANRQGGFSSTEADNLLALSSAAAVAVENARLFTQSQQKQRWITASQGITTMLLSGATEEEALEYAVATVRDVADADAALLILPSVGSQWVCELYDGDSAAGLLGTVFPPNGRAMIVARTGHGVVVDSLATTMHLKVPALSAFGPALYAPMRTRDNTVGVFLILRQPGDPEFTESDLESAQTVAAQAALALELAEAKHRADVATLQAERDSIGRDLHDLAIQQLFAAGMQLSALRETFTQALTELETNGVIAKSINQQHLLQELEVAFERVGDSAEQIRSIVRGLRNQKVDFNSDRTFIDKVAAEASLARSSLGFAPNFIIEFDGKIVNSKSETFEEISSDIENMMPDSIEANAIAVIREALANAAKHARATAVTVNIEIDTATPAMTITISDNGRGLPEKITRQSGLRNMRMRAESNGGSLNITSDFNAGTTLNWYVPL